MHCRYCTEKIVLLEPLRVLFEPGVLPSGETEMVFCSPVCIWKQGTRDAAAIVENVRLQVRQRK